jgi:ATP-dependent Clp protease ATP-binding subunit ClpB
MSSRGAETTLSLERYAPDAKAIVAGAQTLADESKHVEVEPLHLLAHAIERNAAVRSVFERAGTRVAELSASLGRALATLPRSKEPAYLADSMLDLLERAEREATRERAPNVGVEHLLNAVTQEIRGAAGEVLGAFGLAPGSLRSHFAPLHAAERPARDDANPSRSGLVTDLVELARTSAMEPVIGRVNEVRRLLTVLERRDKHHPLLVGEPGVGKRSVVRALSQRIAQGDVPASLSRLRLFSVDTGALVSGARLRGEVEERVRKLLLQVTGEASVVVLFGLEQLFGQGAAGASVGDVFRPALLSGELRVLGTTTPDGLKRLEEKDAHLLRLFTLLTMEEPDAEAATEIVRGVASRYEAHHRVQVTEGAIVAAVRLAKRYVEDRRLPESALDLLDESAASKRVAAEGLSPEADGMLRRLEMLQAQLGTLAGATDATSNAQRERIEADVLSLSPQVTAAKNELSARKSAEGAAEPLLGEDDVARTVSEWTGVPVSRMLEGEADKLLGLESRLGGRVIGQDQAVVAVARAVRRGRVGLRDTRRPIGSFLFLGPSGVGKTELAKALSDVVYDDERALTRLDMSEFMERHMAQRLLGAPPGYADSEQGGFLTEAVRRRPYSVLLFDEVEKAHQDVFNLLLQLLDDGRLTDGRGRLADFSNTLVIMTSNIGSERILETDPKLFESDAGREALRDVLLGRLREFFRPELLNRIDEVVVFRPLSREHLGRIVGLELAKLERLLAERRVSLEVDDSAKAFLVSLGYEPALGARPLKRAILRELSDPLAEALLQGKFPEGARVRVTESDGRLQFS